MNTEDEPNSAGFDKYNSKLLSNRPIMSSHKKNKYLSKIEEMDGKVLLPFKIDK